MERITVNLKTVVGFCFAAIVIDLIYLALGVVHFGGELWVPESWSLDYFITPPDVKMTTREILFLSLLGAAICIYGWAMSLIDPDA